MESDRGVDRWIALEMARLQQSLVTAPRSVRELAAEEEPTARTRGGEPYRFDRAVVLRIHQTLGPLARSRVRLPVTFYLDKDLPEDAHVADEHAADMLRALGELPAGLQPREGKLWLGHAKARLIAEKYPTAFQFVLY